MNLIQNVPLRTALLGGAEALDPESILGTDLVGWWDSSDVGSLTISGGKVTDWADKSGQSHTLTQPDSARQPLEPSSRFAGILYDGADGVGANDVLDSGIGNTNPQNIWDGGAHIFVVLRYGGVGGSAFGTVYAKGSANARLRAQSDTVMRWVFAFSTTNGVWTFTPTKDQVIILDIAYNADDVTNNPIISENGVAITATETQTPVGTRNTDASDSTGIGGTRGQTRGWDDKIHEVIFSDRIVTGADYAKMINYLKNKWDIS